MKGHSYTQSAKQHFSQAQRHGNTSQFTRGVAPARLMIGVHDHWRLRQRLAL
jgi:hypothetical protein